MWRTGCGERTLEGAEAVVFAEALMSLLDEAVTANIESTCSRTFHDIMCMLNS